MTQLAAQQKKMVNVSAAELEQQIRARIDALSYLPTSVGVAMKFIELGKDPEASPHDYAKVVSADSSLSAKILSLANSSWFGVRNKVTKVSGAINLLGLGTVRTLAISYCMAGLNNELRLNADESRMFWEASLCKAVAAKQFAAKIDAKVGDEAFAMALFQDFSIPVMYATAKERLLPILQDAALDYRAHLRQEREIFRLDHTEIGRILAQKLELPESFVDAVAFHHDYDNLSDFMESEVCGDAVFFASLFPHVLHEWNRQDAEELRKFMSEHTQDVDEQLVAIQKEFDQLYKFFEDSGTSEIRLVEMMESATEEAANNTTQLIGTVNALMQQAASTGMEMNKLVNEQNRLETDATHDPLTGVFNRKGMIVAAKSLLAQMARYGVGFAVAYLDLDKFKQANDTLGHEFGDRVLKQAVHFMTEAVRPKDIVGRIGGDEFVLLLNDCTQEDADKIVGRIITNVAEKPLGRGKRKAGISVSAGLLWVKPSRQEYPLDKLLGVADKLMYQAKRAGGNRVQSTTLPSD